jgi:hypothetical protein
VRGSVIDWPPIDSRSPAARLPAKVLPGLVVVAGGADRLKVRDVAGAALGAGYNVISDRRRGHPRWGFLPAEATEGLTRQELRSSLAVLPAKTALIAALVVAVVPRLRLSRHGSVPFFVIVRGRSPVAFGMQVSRTASQVLAGSEALTPTELR